MCDHGKIISEATVAGSGWTGDGHYLIAAAAAVEEGVDLVMFANFDATDVRY